MGSIKQRVEGPLTKQVQECAARLDDTVKTLEEVSKNGDEEQLRLRHVMDAETHLLKTKKQAEEAFVQAIDEARMAAAEADEDAMACNDDEPAAAVRDASNMDFLVKSAAARLVDHERNAKDASDAHIEVQAALEAAKQELENMPLQGGSDTEVISSNTFHQRIALEAWLHDLEVMTHEKETASMAASSAAVAAKEELQDSESRHESSRIVARPLKEIICEELNIVESSLRIHQERGTAIMAEAGEREVAWTTEKEALGADLHRAQLQAIVAEEAVSVASGLAKTLRSNKSERASRHASRVATRAHIIESGED